MPQLLKQSTAEIPHRQFLIERLELANRAARVWVVLQLLALIAVGWFIDWDAVVTEPLLSTVAIGLMIGPVSMGILQLWAQRKKEIGDLKEDTRFGAFDKHRLRMLQRDTLRRLGLPDEHLPVYITADKSLNASALRLGLGVFFKSLNGIYLHRQILHKLNAEEVQDIMGHELGHYYRHYLVSDRFRALTITLGGGIGLLAAQITGMTSIVSVLITSACASAFWKLAGIPWARHGKTIEFLCDDLGAQVHGVHVSINGLLKLGAEAEVQLAIQQQAILSQKNGHLSSREIVQAVEAAIPYGHASRAELEASVQRSIQQRTDQARRATLIGFLKYAWQSDTEAALDEELEEQARKLKKLHSVPRLDWEELLTDPESLHFEPHELPRLITLIESHPHAVLFHLPQELGNGDDVHPPLRERILYLWRNRDEIGLGQLSGGRSISQSSSVLSRFGGTL